MTNLSYCRFRNTLKDLKDCYDHIDDNIEDREEKTARSELIELCSSIAQYQEAQDE